MKLEEFGSFELYVQIGKEDVAFQILKDFEAQKLMPPLNIFPSIGYLVIYLELEDPDKAEKALEEFESFLKITKWEALRSVFFMAQGEIQKFRKEFSQAIESYIKALEIAPPEEKVELNILSGACYRKLQEFKKAEELIQEALKVEPFNPEAHYEIALVYWDMGKKEKALEHLKKALYVWEEADLEYKPAKKARDKLTEWESYTSRVQ